MKVVVAAVDVADVRLACGAGIVPSWCGTIGGWDESVGGSKKSNAAAVVEGREEMRKVGDVGMGLVSKPMQPNQRILRLLERQRDWAVDGTPD
jgi:hypothetical protein